MTQLAGEGQRPCGLLRPSRESQFLEQFPERNTGQIDPLFTVGKYRKLLLEKKYLLVYQIKEAAVMWMQL